MNQAELRVHATVVSLTAVTMYWLLPVALALNVEPPNPWIGAAAAALTSVGIYRAFALLTSIALRRSALIGRMLLGPAWLAGTWVGYLELDDGSREAVVEIYEQDLSSLNIRGQSFLQDGEFSAEWTSEATHVDINRGSVYAYYSTQLRQRENPMLGFGRLNLQRPRPTAPATAMAGFSVDVGRDGGMTHDEIRLHSRKLLRFREAVPAALEALRGSS